MIIKAAAVGAVFTAVLILASSGGQVDRMTFGDGRFYQYVATHMDAGLEDLSHVVATRGPSLRYGRIALPALTWLLAGGKPGLMPYTQPIVMVLSGAAISAAAAIMVRRAGKAAAVIPFLAIGLPLALSGGFVEPLAAAAILWAVVSVIHRRWIPAALLLSLAMLSRETAGAVVLALIVWAIWRREWKGALILAAAFLPVAGWHAAVAVRFGHLPTSDPYLAAAGVERIPFKSILTAMTDREWPIRVAAGVHLFLGAVAVTRFPSSALGAAAAGSALQLAVVPSLTWLYAGDTLRTFAFLQLLTLLAVASALLDRRANKDPDPAQTGDE